MIASLFSFDDTFEEYYEYGQQSNMWLILLLSWTTRLIMQRVLFEGRYVMLILTKAFLSVCYFIKPCGWWCDNWFWQVLPKIDKVVGVCKGLMQVVVCPFLTELFDSWWSYPWSGPWVWNNYWASFVVGWFTQLLCVIAVVVSGITNLFELYRCFEGLRC